MAQNEKKGHELKPKKLAHKKKKEGTQTGTESALAQKKTRTEIEAVLARKEKKGQELKQKQHKKKIKNTNHETETVCTHKEEKGQLAQVEKNSG